MRACRGRRLLVAEVAEFVFTEEQGQLRDAVRRFCAENFDEQTVRRLMESDPPFDPKSWHRLGSELGVLGPAGGGSGGCGWRGRRGRGGPGSWTRVWGWTTSPRPGPPRRRSGGCPPPP